LLHDPVVLTVDEPANSLDPGAVLSSASRSRLFGKKLRLVRRRGHFDLVYA
jgi:hypothetical protein